MSFIETLEYRIAPATLVNPTTVTFKDIDGDVVTVKLSKPLFAAATIDNVLKFSTGVTGGDNTVAQQLQSIDLTALANAATAADGLKITVSAKRGTGDGLVNVGAINAVGIDLGVVKIGGDLGQIDAGDGEAKKPALAGLDVKSMGEFGVTTQASGGSLASSLAGVLGSLKIAGNLREASMETTGAGAGIKSIAIGGSVLGGLADDSGRIFAAGDIGSLTVKGGLKGLDGERSAQIRSEGKIGKATVLLSLEGGDGDNSAQLSAQQGIGSVKIGRNLRGGVGEASASIDGGPSIGAITIGGSMLGGDGDESASIVAETFGGSMKSILVRGEIRGGAGEESAYIHADRFIGPITVIGSVTGGDGPFSAVIYAGNAVSTQSNIVSITVFGDVRGGDVGSFAGALGNAGFGLGAAAALDIGKVVVKGSLVGGLATGGGEIRANDIGSITIGGSLNGTVQETATIFTTGTIKTLTITGSVYGGTGASSGRIAPFALGTLNIGGNLEGGSGEFSGEVSVDRFGQNLSGPNSIKSVFIGGIIQSGSGATGGALHLNAPLGKLALGGATGTAANPVEIEVRGKDFAGEIIPALGALTINGSATFLNVLGGYFAGVVENVDAVIGKVTVNGDWIAGSIAASVEANGEGFGTPDDSVPINNSTPFAAIASIVIKGQVIGTVGGIDHFGFVAERIGKLKIGAVNFPFSPVLGQSFTLGATEDFTAREVSVGGAA